MTGQEQTGVPGQSEPTPARSQATQRLTCFIQDPAPRLRYGYSSGFHKPLAYSSQGDSGKSTVLKVSFAPFRAISRAHCHVNPTNSHSRQQMRLIHKVGFTPEEIESYRQLVFGNLVNGMRLVLESMPLFDLSVEESNQVRVKFPRIHSRPFFPYERHVTAR